MSQATDPDDARFATIKELRNRAGNAEANLEAALDVTAELLVERDRLKVVNDGLVALVDETLAFVAAWAGTYQASHDLDDIHPKHQETIDKIQAVLAEARKP